MPLRAICGSHGHATGDACTSSAATVIVGLPLECRDHAKAQVSPTWSDPCRTPVEPRAGRRSRQRSLATASRRVPQYKTGVDWALAGVSIACGLALVVARGPPTEPWRTPPRRVTLERMHEKPRRPSHATVVAYLALFVALGGSSYAAVTLERNSVRTKHIARGAVTSAKVLLAARPRLCNGSAADRAEG